MAKPVVLRFVADTKRLSRAFLKTSAEAETFGKKVQKVGMGVALGVGAAAAGAGVYLAKLGGDFHSAYATIRTTTGKTGKELKGLEDSFRNVLSQTPAGMGDVAGAISGINQKLGLTGKPLEEFSLQMIRLGRITKTDVGDNVKSVTAVLNNWSVPASKAADTTDMLFRASQKSGVAVSELAAQLGTSGAQFRALGFDLTDTTSLLGLLGKSGLSAGDVMPALAKVMAKSAKEGKSAGETFRQVFSAIALAPNATDAAKIAFDTFGSRAGPKFAQLIREGKLSFDAFSKSIRDGKGTIADTAKETGTWQGKLGTLKNQISVALEPLATKVFGAITDAVSDLMPWFKKLGDWIKTHKEDLKPFAIALGVVAAALTVVAVATAAWNAVLAINPITLIIVGIALLVAGLVLAYKKFDWFRNAVDAVVRFVREKVIPAFKEFGQWIEEHVWPAIKKLGSWIKDSLWPTLRDIAVFVNGAFVKAWHALSDVITNVWTGLKWTWDHIGSPIFSAIGTAIDIVVSAVSTFASAFVDPFSAVVGAVKALWNGLASVWNSTVGKFSITLPTWLPDPLGGASFNVPDLPYLADGGIVTRPTIAMIGEAGPEAVVPLGRLGTGGSTYNVTVHAMDPRAAAVAVVDALKVYERNRGPIPIRTRTA